MPQTTSASPRFALLAVLAAAAVALTGCGAPPAASEDPAPTNEVALPAAAGVSAPSPIALTALAGPRLRPDVLVRVDSPLTPKQVHAVAVLAPGAIAFTTGVVRLNDKPVHIASVDPDTFRRFAAAGTAESTAVWQSVANGGIIASHSSRSASTCRWAGPARRRQVLARPAARRPGHHRDPRHRPGRRPPPASSSA